MSTVQKVARSLTDIRSVINSFLVHTRFVRLLVCVRARACTRTYPRACVGLYRVYQSCQQVFHCLTLSAPIHQSQSGRSESAWNWLWWLTQTIPTDLCARQARPQTSWCLTPGRRSVRDLPLTWPTVYCGEFHSLRLTNHHGSIARWVQPRFWINFNFSKIQDGSTHSFYLILNLIENEICSEQRLKA
jgi:hypothetical protein